MLTEIKYNETQDGIQVKLTLGAARIYQAQFNRDLFTDLYDLAVDINSRAIDKAMKSIKFDQGIEKMTAEQITENIIANIDVADILVEKPLTLEQCDRAVNVIWAFAKNADATIPLPEKWLETFELFPIRVLVNQLFDKWTAAQNGTIELKNA